MKKLKVAVVGATGYTGEELLRLLLGHSRVEVTYVSGKEDRSVKIQDIFPSLRGKLDLECRALSPEEAAGRSDFIFLSLPHTVSMEQAPFFLKARKKVVDTSADYRLKDTALYEKFYKTTHKDPANLKRAVYGLPETNRAQIKRAALVANPGCYPTGAVLGLLPGLRRKAFEPDSIRIDSKSGVTGAGRKAEKTLHFSEVNESLKAYKLFEHPHAPEIEQELGRIAGRRFRVVFVPHLVPLNRGILSTITVRLKKRMESRALVRLYRDFYRGEPFVQVFEDGLLPELKHVVRTNNCGIGLKADPEKKHAVLVTAIDNLVKGAAGQAVQNMNIMSGFKETEGLL